MHAYELSKMAESDLESILEYTFDNLGKNQMSKNNKQPEECLKRLVNNPASYRNHNLGSKVLRSLHCQKHYIFALERENSPLLIVAVLHERMDLVKRLRNRL